MFDASVDCASVPKEWQLLHRDELAREATHAPIIVQIAGLSNPANIDDRTGVVLEPFAQLDELRLVG